MAQGPFKNAPGQRHVSGNGTVLLVPQRKRHAMRPTLADIAQRARTTEATVSRVLNDRPGVGAKRREVILRIAEEMGYVPNRNARGLASRKGYLWGLITADLNNPCYVSFLRRMEHFGRSHDKQVLVADSHMNLEQEEANIKTMLEHRAEALAIWPVCDWYNDEKISHLIRLRNQGLPFVVLAKVPGQGFDCVYIEEHKAGAELTEHLISIGHRRILFLQNDLVTRPARERLEGARQTVADAGLPAEALRVVQYDTGPWRNAFAKQIAGKNPPTALIAINGTILCRALTEMSNNPVLGKKNLALCCFDSEPWMDIFSPPITAMVSNQELLADRAMQCLERRMRKPDSPVQCDSIPQRLIVRESTSG